MKPSRNDLSIRMDERDTMFARMARRAGSAPYTDYYSRNPGLKRKDDRLRKMIPLFEPGSLHYHPEIVAQAASYAAEIEELAVDQTEVGRWQRMLADSQTPTETIKLIARELGAVAVGCTTLEQAYLYTHKGRLDDDYGREVQLADPTVIVFLVEMDFGAMQRAPRAEVLRESCLQYLRAARISLTIEAALQAAGYSAKAHYDAHYDLILPPLAIAAGLGELGRHNILIAERYGTRVRIGAVSTDFPLEHDSARLLGADRFCEICKKCADNCPSHALAAGEKSEIRGVAKWPTNAERCYGYWRQVGTDCGICMAVCPFSHRDNWFHNLVRWVILRMPWTARIALYCDDLIYGRRWKDDPG